MICAALSWWQLLAASTSVRSFVSCSSKVFCPCSEVRRVVPELWASVSGPLVSSTFCCRVNSFILLLGCEVPG